MKTFFTTADTPLRISVLLFLLLFTNSCIYDEPDDQFYRTLWVCEEWKEVTRGFGEVENNHDRSADRRYKRSIGDGTGESADGLSEAQNGEETESNLGDEVPDGPPSRLTIDFLCDGKVRVTATGASGSYGNYEHHGNTAYFHNTSLSYPCDGNPIVIVIEEAHRTHDLLLISWHYSGSDISYSTRLVRKSSY